MPNIGFEQGGQPLIGAEQGTLPASSPPAPQPVIPDADWGGIRVIYDTDMGTDVDDFGALAVLHTLADLGGCEILGTVISSACQFATPATDALNKWRGRQHQIGQWKGAQVVTSADDDCTASNNGNYTEPITNDSATYPRDLNVGDDLDPTALYRQLLADNEGQKIRIVTVGFLTTLADLLRSPGDAIDPRNGIDLVADTVDAIVSMGSQNAVGGGDTAWNFFWAWEDAQYVFDNCPVRIIISPVEVGSAVQTATTQGQRPVGHIVRFAYEQWGASSGRSSWDLIAVMDAIAREASVGLYSYQQGFLSIPSEGVSNFGLDSNGDHFYQSLDTNASNVEDLIEPLIWGDLIPTRDNALHLRSYNVPVALPTASTLAATDVNQTSVTLNGELTELLDADAADVFFRYREIGASEWIDTPVETLTATGNFTRAVSGISAGTSYEFQAAADSEGVKDFGSELTFTTATDTPGTVTRTGTVTRNGSPVQGADVVFITRADLLANATAQTTTGASGEYSAEIPTGEDMVGIALEGADGDSTPFTEGA